MGILVYTELEEYDVELQCTPILLKEDFSAGYGRKIVSEPENGVRLGEILGPRELGMGSLAGLPRILHRSMAMSPNSKSSISY
jgi:hypothetical protein